MSSTDQAFHDLQALAKRVIDGNNFEADLQIFQQFAGDLQLWVLDNFDSYRVRQLAKTVPEIEYQRKRGGLWGALGASGIQMYKKHQKREEVKAQVREIARRFEAIHRLLADDTDDIV